MRTAIAHLLTVGCLAGCGGNATSAGSGTGTLLVDAQVSEEEGNASFRIEVRRAGHAVTDATVTLASDVSGATLTSNDEGVYRGTAPGWGDHYDLSVSSGPDHLQGTIETPSPATIFAPDPTMAFDPHTATSGTIELRWRGALADTVQVKTKDFEWGPMADPGRITVSANIFVESTQEVRVIRSNETALAGGVTGSQLSASSSTTTELIIRNPF